MRLATQGMRFSSAPPREPRKSSRQAAEPIGENGDLCTDENNQTAERCSKKSGGAGCLAPRPSNKQPMKSVRNDRQMGMTAVENRSIKPTEDAAIMSGFQRRDSAASNQRTGRVTTLISLKSLPT
jgi:hypothetical protein